MSKEELSSIHLACNRHAALMAMFSLHHLSPVEEGNTFRICFINPNEHLPNWSTTEPYGVLKIRRDNVRNLTLETTNDGGVNLHLNTPFHGGIPYDIVIPEKDIVSIDLTRRNGLEGEYQSKTIFFNPNVIADADRKAKAPKMTKTGNVTKVDFTQR